MIHAAAPQKQKTGGCCDRGREVEEEDMRETGKKLNWEYEIWTNIV